MIDRDRELPPLIRRRDALCRGFTDHELRRARRSGELQSVRRGVYVAPHLLDRADSHLQHRLLIQASVDASHCDSVVSHPSAAVLHGIALWNVSLDRVHLTMNARSGGRVVRRRHVHTAPLLSDEVVIVDGVAVTSVARTVVDIARTVPFEQAVVVADSALHEGLVRLDELGAALESAGSRHGIPGARRAITFADGRSESVGESAVAC